MRVALLSYNAQFHNAVGNHVAEKVRFFQERGAEVRLFVQDARRLHPDVRSCTRELAEPRIDGPAWDYLSQADLVFAVYGQYYDLLQYLPRLAGTGPRIVFDYLGVTPPRFWNDQHRESLEKASQMRGYAWCADHVLTISDANRRELLDATNFPLTHATTLPLAVNAAQFQPDSTSRFLQKRMGIDGRILLYVGRLAGNKRVTLLIDALARLGDPTVHVVIVGDCRDVYAAEAARCVELARERGVARRVHLVGELSDHELSQAYRSASVFVMPSVHEGFCVPVIEAMASGCPVIASRSAALPETVGDAGLTFVAGDADDLARQIRRVLDHASGEMPAPARPRRVAIVSCRFGPEIVGGAETSLRTMAESLQAAGHHVEVFATCATTEGNWKNDLPAGSATLDGVTLHRFPVDSIDFSTHDAIAGAIVAADGIVAPEIEERYLEKHVHSRALMTALRARQDEFDAIITGPYLLGLTAEIARAFPHKTLVVPCFHEEPQARLALWARLYGEAGGILYHSAEEKHLAQTWLGVNHPNSAVMGTCVRRSPTTRTTSPPIRIGRPYVVYCGRYSEQKNVLLLVEWARRFQERHPNRLDFVFIGQREIKLPSEPWLHDLGFVDEEMKRSIVAGALALIQLSHNESLSLVVLEAWAEQTPVIVHRDCDVLAGQIERSRGGAAVTDFAQFAAVLDDWLKDDLARHEIGANGHVYLEQNYCSSETYVAKIVTCIDRLRTPLSQQMRTRGIDRAQNFSRDRWQSRFATFVDNVLTQSARPSTSDLRIEPLRSNARAAGSPSLLLPVRLVNHGTRLAASEGPGRSVICCEIRSAATDAVVAPCTELPLPSSVMPGQSLVAVLPLEIPIEEGAYCIRLWPEQQDRAAAPNGVTEIELNVHEEGSASDSCVSVFLDTIARTLPKAHHMQQLPRDYLDVTEGTLAPIKAFLKRKMLHNFKHAYVDVLSRQQTQMNGQLVLMIQQLSECCAMLDQRLAALERFDTDAAESATEGNPRSSLNLRGHDEAASASRLASEDHAR